MKSSLCFDNATMSGNLLNSALPQISDETEENSCQVTNC
jgi:hypothetical protein